MKEIKINNFEDAALDVYARLSEVQLLRYNEPKQGIFIAESPKVILRALAAGYEPISVLKEDKLVEEEKEVLGKLGDIPVYVAPFDVLTRLTGFKLTRGMLCAFHRRQMPTLEEICQEKKRIAILENVMNPTNVGAIFRSAAALNMDAVLLTSGCSDPLYRRSARVSMGTVFQIPWTYIPESAWSKNAMEQLAAMGYKTAAMALTDDSVSIDDEKLMQEEQLAIVLGTEGDGLAGTTIEGCDYTVKIPMSHNVDSLNVAAASAVAFWQLGQRKA